VRPKQDELTSEGVSALPSLPMPLPVDPADFVVLAVSIAIAALASAYLVAAEQHGHPLRQEQCRQEIAHCRLRSPAISGSSVGPSAPQFHCYCCPTRSWLSSLFASLCFSL